MRESVQNHIRGLNFNYRVTLREKNVTYLNKLGKFINPHTLEVTDKKGKVSQLTASRFVVATGGRPTTLDCEGGEHAITSDDIFSLEQVRSCEERERRDWEYHNFTSARSEATSINDLRSKTRPRPCILPSHKSKIRCSSCRLQQKRRRRQPNASLNVQGRREEGHGCRRKCECCQRRAKYSMLTRRFARRFFAGHPLFLSSQDIQLNVNESLHDTSKVLTRFNDIILARVNSNDTIETLSKECGEGRVINALCDMYHPLQTLADLLTLEEQWGRGGCSVRIPSSSLLVLT